MSKTAPPAKRAKRSLPAKARATAKRPAVKRKPAARPTQTTHTTAEKRVAKPRLPSDVKAAVAAAQDKLAVDLTVLDLRNATAFTDFFVICTGTNPRQVQAIADGIETRLRAEGQKPALVEGYSRGEWVLMDYFNFIVHIFLPARRTFYALERLWGGAEPIEVSAP